MAIVPTQGDVTGTPNRTGAFRHGHSLRVPLDSLPTRPQLRPGYPSQIAPWRREPWAEPALPGPGVQQ